MNLLYSDYKNNIHVKWKQLIDDVNQAETYNPYCFEEDYYSIFRHIILSLLHGQHIILLDSDLSQEEISSMVNDMDISKSTKTLTLEKKLISKDDLLDRLIHTGADWSIILFTSGTTGLPKKVEHTFSSISANVKISERHADDVWGFAYNPTHMAGIQVFFQAILNGNTLVRLFGLSKEEIFRSFIDGKITNISATPTFYRLLFPMENKFNDIKRVTLGGEKLDTQLVDKIIAVFPNAKITNIFASTEAGALFASQGEYFLIDEHNEEYVKIDNNELLIHKSKIGKVENLTEDWYRTGDLVEIISDDPLRFKFTSRKNEMINVGGYKVNPHEVEEAIRKIEGINEVRVYPKKNSLLGNIICCDISTNNMDLNEKWIREYLKDKIQDFKIPRIIKLTDSIDKTRTGKIKRELG